MQLTELCSKQQQPWHSAAQPCKRARELLLQQHQHTLQPQHPALGKPSIRRDLAAAHAFPLYIEARWAQAGAPPAVRTTASACALQGSRQAPPLPCRAMHRDAKRGRSLERGDGGSPQLDPNFYSQARDSLSGFYTHTQCILLLAKCCAMVSAATCNTLIVCASCLFKSPKASQRAASTAQQRSRSAPCRQWRHGLPAPRPPGQLRHACNDARIGARLVALHRHIIHHLVAEPGGGGACRCLCGVCGACVACARNEA